MASKSLPNGCRPQTSCRSCHQGHVGVKEADISPENLVVRFAESVDGFPLPKGHSENPDLQAEQKPGAEAFLAEKK